MTDNENRSVTSGLQPFPWSNDQSVAYEVAIEVIGQAMACYAALIEKEKNGANRPELIEEFRAARAEGADLRNRLGLFDDAAVARACDEYGALVRRLREKLVQ